MSVKRVKKPTFTVQVKVVLIADVNVEADSLTEAIELGKTWVRKDVVSLDDAASECDSKTTVVAAWSEHSWSVD